MPAQALGFIEVMVPMRDGIRLATDIYGLDAFDRPRPVVFERTPYGKRESRDSDQAWHDRPVPLPEEIARHFVEAGFIVVRQDCRGRGRSEGEFVKYLGEAEDGADAVEWIAAQSWCDGRVAMTGVSYSAHVQAAAAAAGCTGLAALFMDSGGFASAYETGMRMGGAFELKQLTWAYKQAAVSPLAETEPLVRRAIESRDLRDWFSALPWRAGTSPVRDAPEYESYVIDQWRHEDFTEFWKNPAIYARGGYDRFPDAPAFFISSWYDPYIRAAVDNFEALTSQNESPTFLLLGAWTHGKRCRSFSGDVDFGPNAWFDGNVGESYLQFRSRWFSDVLAGRDPGVPLVQFFVMGGGSGRRRTDGRLDHGGYWASSTTWPPAESQSWELHLDPDGVLVEQPVAEPATLRYDFDPARPVPTIGGQVTSGEPVMFGGAYNQVTGPDVYGATPPYLPLDTRNDVLVFRTLPLRGDVVCAGPVRVTLHVSSDAPDTDFTVKLIDEYPPSEDYPDGYAMNLTESILRMRYRDSFEAPALMAPGEVYEIEISAPDTANCFAAGHRIRLDVSSSDFPRFDVNPNTGTVVVDERRRRVAENAVHCGGDRRSRLRLNVIPA